MALEQALARPDPTESLESLIIDLARVASDEAHASAARRWLEAQASAEAQRPAAVAAEAGSGIHGALIEEAAGLRREVEELRARIQRETERGDALRRDNETAQAALRDERAGKSQFDGELSQLRSANVDLTDAVETLRGELDAARKRLADATTQINTATAREADLERTLAAERDQRRRELEAAEARIAEAAARAEVADAAAGGQASRVRELEAALAAESAKGRESDAALARAADTGQTLRAELAAEIEKARAAQADGSAAAEKLAAIEARLFAESDRVHALEADVAATTGKLRAAEEELSSARADVSAEAEKLLAAKADHDSSKTVFDAARQEAAAALAAATARIRDLEIQLFRREQASAESPDEDLGAMLEERAPAGERPIRRFSRYSFRSRMVVDIEGASAQLVDLSVGGAQVLSEVPLELHHEAAVQLVSDEIPVSGRAKVMWSRADPRSKGRALRYRAGLQFTDVDPAAVEAYIIRYSST